MGEVAAEADTPEDLAADAPLRLRAVETLAAGMRIPRRLVETSAETSTAGMLIVAAVPMVVAADITAVAVDITVAADITAVERISDPASVSAFTRLTDMPRRPAIPLDSMINTVSGSIIRVAPCLTDIKHDGRL